MQTIRIEVGQISITARLLDTPTAKAIYQQLPISAKAQTWGEEVYFNAGVSTTLEPDAKDIVTAGEIAYWVEGSCIAIGFGPTPISQGNEIRLAAKTNIWATALDDVTQLKHVQDGDLVTVHPQ